MSITRVQGNQINSSASVTTQAITLSTGATLGNLLVVAFATGNNATTLTGPARWTQAVINQPAGASATIETAIFYLVVGASDAGATSFTFTLSASHTAYLCIEEWNSSTGWLASPLDVTAQGDTIGTPVTATTISSGTTATTAIASELWVASLAYKNSAQTETSITSGWTKDLEATLASNNTMTLLYQIASATGTASCSYAIGTAQFWAGAAATFKPNTVTNNTMASIDALTVTDSALFTDGLAETLVSQVATDTFTRANQSGWGTASSGQTWGVNGIGTLSIVSNEGVLVSLNADTNVQLGTATINDADVLCRFSINLAADIAGVQARYTANNGVSTCYKLLYYSSSVNINRSLSGTITNLSTASATLTTSVFYWLRFRVVGSTLSGRFWQDGTSEPTTWTLTTTDTSIVGPGGVGVLGNTTTSSTGAQFDHFAATDYNVDAVPISDVALFTDGVLAMETTPVVDSFTGTESYLPTDSLVLADTYLATGVSLPIENLTTSDLLLSTDTTLPLDTTPVSDLQSALQTWPVDALILTESFLASETYTPLDAVSVSDALLITDIAASTENLAMGDRVLMQDGYIPLDALSLADSLLGSATYLPTDILSTSDALLVQDGYGVVEALSGSDIASYADLLNATEALTISEVPLVTDTYLPIDANAVADAGGLTQTSSGSITNNTMASTDALIITDGYLATDTALPADLLSASDALLSVDSLGVIESNTVSDLTAALQSWPVENLSVSDKLVAQETYLPVEVNSVGDSLINGSAYSATESLITSDALSGGSVYQSSDIFPVTDLFTGLTAYSVTDANTLTDALVTGNTYNVIDGLSMSDGALYTLMPVSSELLIAIDTWLQSDGYGVVDGLSVADLSAMTMTSPTGNTLIIVVEQLSIIDISACFSSFIIPSTTIKRTLTATSGKRLLITSSGKRLLLSTSGKRRLITTTGKRTAVTTSGKRILTIS